MKDKTLKILLGIIAINLTVQTVKDVGLFPTAYAQSGVQKIAICNQGGGRCAEDPATYYAQSEVQNAQSGVQKIAICNSGGGRCADVQRHVSNNSLVVPIFNYGN